MLHRLTVSNLAVVERAEAEFAPGLNVLTGETGAGKSVLMGALGLVLGGRADASIVRDGAKEAEVEADFEVEKRGGGGAGGGARMSIRRTVTREGRSRAWVNDESVSIAELRELGRTLVDIHGPTANQRLMEEAFQRETLDAYAGIQGFKVSGLQGFKVLANYQSAFSELAELKSQVSRLMSSDGEDVEFLRFQVNELEEAALSEDDETIAERHAAAAHAEDIVENANAITEALGGDQSAAEILIQLQPRFREIAKHLPSAAEWAAEAEDLTVKVQELSRTVADAASKMDVGDEDLEALDARLTLINRLLRKYRASDVSGLMSSLVAKKSKLDALEHREERIAELNAKIAVADKQVRKAGAELTKLRAGAAERLSAAVTKELKDLGFLQAKFFVALEPIEPETHGMDRVVYMFEPNPGEQARPLAAIASSGEIARVMLAIKVAGLKGCKVEKLKGCKVEEPEGDEPATFQPFNLSTFQPLTLVFDEIDANIGGEVGKAVGEKMKAVARHHQVIAITHLPQSAVYGDRHLVVSKRVSGGRTRTGISEVEGEDRISEVARMLGGEKLTSVVRKHAEELLQLSR